MQQLAFRVRSVGFGAGAGVDSGGQRSLCSLRQLVFRSRLLRLWTGLPFRRGDFSSVVHASITQGVHFGADSDADLGACSGASDGNTALVGLRTSFAAGSLSFFVRCCSPVVFSCRVWRGCSVKGVRVFLVRHVLQLSELQQIQMKMCSPFAGRQQLSGIGYRNANS